MYQSGNMAHKSINIPSSISWILNSTIIRYITESILYVNIKKNGMRKIQAARTIQYPKKIDHFLAHLKPWKFLTS